MTEPRYVQDWEWTPVNRPGCHGVEARMVFAGPSFMLVMLRFGARATIDPHAAPHRIDVVCIEGQGTVLTGSVEGAFREGQTVRWLPGVVHCLSTGESTMTTLMIEHVGLRSGLT